MFEQDDDPFAKYAQPQQPAPAQPVAPKSPTTGQPIGKTKLGFPLWNERQARKAREIEDAGYEITATTNGRHATNSPHYNGTGFDIRTKDLHPDSIAALKRDIAARKGARIDYEQPGANANTTNEHLHYDFTDEADATPAPSKAQPVGNDPFAKYVQPDTPVGQTSEPQTQSLSPVTPQAPRPTQAGDEIKILTPQETEAKKQAEEMNRGRVENGQFILDAGSADTTPSLTQGAEIKRNNPLMMGVAERGKLIEKGQAEASTPFQLQANRKFKPQQLETMIVGSPDKPPTQDEILNAALREVGVSRADAAKIWKNREGNPIGSVDTALQQQGGNLRYDADTGTWRHTIVISPEAQQLVDNFRNGKAPDAVDDSQSAQLQNAISQGLEQSPNMVAGLESAASGLLKTGSNVAKLATLQNPQTAPENKLDEMSGAFGQDAEKARQYMTTAEKVKTGLLSGAVTLPLINEIVVNGGLPAFIAQNLAGRAHLSKDEQIKGAITDLAMLSTGNLVGGQIGAETLGQRTAGTLANAGMAGSLQSLGAVGSGAAKDAGDLAENFITGTAFGLNAPHEKRAGVEGIGNVRPNEPGSPEARAYADTQEAKMAQDAELLARAGQAQRAMEAQANLANNGIRPDGTEAQPNIGQPQAKAPAQNSNLGGLKARIEAKKGAGVQLDENGNIVPVAGKAAKPEVPQTVEIIAPDATPEVTAGTKLREIEIDGVTHVVRIPAKMDKETARILTRAQLKGQANESSQTESPVTQANNGNAPDQAQAPTTQRDAGMPEPIGQSVRSDSVQTSPQIKPEAGAQTANGAAKPNLDAEIAAFDAARNEVKSNNGTQAQTLPAPVASVQGASPSGNRNIVRPTSTGEQAGSTRSTQERPQTQEQTVKPLKPIDYGIDRENVISEIRKMGGIDARHARTGEFKDLAREYPALFRKDGNDPDVIANSLGLGDQAGALGTYLRDYKQGKASLENLAQRDAEHLQREPEPLPETTARVTPNSPVDEGQQSFRPTVERTTVDEAQLSDIDLAERKYYQKRMQERADLVGDRKTDVGEHGQISNLARRTVADESGNVLQYPMSAHPEWSKHLDITPDASHDQVLDAIAQDLGGKTRSSELSPDDWRGIMATHGADWSQDLKQTVAHTVAAAEVKNKKWDSFLNDRAAQELLNKEIEPRGMALRTRELMKIAERYNDGHKLTNVSDSRVKELLKEIQSARTSELSQERTSKGTHVADEQRAETVTETKGTDQGREPAQSATPSESASQRESRTTGSREKRRVEGDEQKQQSVTVKRKDIQDQTFQPKTEYSIEALHGTTKDFTELKGSEKAVTTKDVTKNAIFLTNDESTAKSYAGNGAKNGKVLEVTATVRNIFDTRSPEVQQLVESAVDKSELFANDSNFYERQQMLLRGDWDIVESPEVQDFIKKNGFDSFIATGDGGRSIGVFDNRNVKIASATQDAESGQQAVREPWQMTRKEWESADDALGVYGSGTSRNLRGAGGQEAARINAKQRLRYGVNDAARERLRQASDGKIKISSEEAAELLDQINTNIQHYGVVRKALAEGKPVPAEVLADYPELAKKPAIKESLKRDGLFIDPRTDAPYPPHMQQALSKAEAYDKTVDRVAVRDVTPKDFAPTESRDSVDPDAYKQSVEYQKKEASLKEAQTLRKDSKISDARKVKLDQDIARYKDDLEELRIADSIQRKSKAAEKLTVKDSLTTDELRRVQKKFESLKESGTPIEDFLAQKSLLGDEFTPAQAEALREMAKGERSAPVSKEQGSMFDAAQSTNIDKFVKDTQIEPLVIIDKFLASKKLTPQDFRKFENYATDKLASAYKSNPRFAAEMRSNAGRDALLEKWLPHWYEGQLGRDTKSALFDAASTNESKLKAAVEAKQKESAKRQADVPPPLFAEKKSNTKASVKMMLTRDDLQQLADLGYSKDERNAMTPDEGARIISEGIRKQKPEPVTQADAPPPLFAEKEGDPRNAQENFKDLAGEYLKNADRLKAKLKRRNGVAFGDDELIQHERSREILGNLFTKNREKGEGFGDYLQRVSGSTERPKSLTFASQATRDAITRSTSAPATSIKIGDKLRYNGSEVTYSGTERTDRKTAILTYPDGEPTHIRKDKLDELWMKQQGKAKDAPANDNASRIAFFEKQLATATEPRARLLRKEIAKLKSEPRLTKAQFKEGGFNLTSFSKPRTATPVNERVPLPTNFDFNKYRKPINKILASNKITNHQVKELTTLAREMQQARADNDFGRFIAVQSDIRELLSKSEWKVLQGVGGMLRTLSLTGELSKVARQGGIALMNDTRKWAQSLPAAFKWSKQSYHNQLATIYSNPFAENAIKLGLDLETHHEITPGHDSQMLGTENALAGGAEKIAGVVTAGLIPAMERGNKAFMDTLRMKQASDIAAQILKGKTVDFSQVKKTPKDTDPQEVKDLREAMRLINITTGRADLGKKAAAAADLLSFFATSPRLAASRVQFIDPTRAGRVALRTTAGQRKGVGQAVSTALNPYLSAVTMGKVSPVSVAGKEIARQQVRVAGTAMVIALGLKAAGVSVSLDPDDSDFMKIKQGNHRWDILPGGLQSPVKLVASTIKNYKTKEFNDATKSTGSKVGSYLRYKESPLASLGHDQVVNRYGLFGQYPSTIENEKGEKVSIGKNAIGEKVTLGDSLKARLLPLWEKSMWDEYHNQGFGAVAALSPEFIGWGAQSYLPSRGDFDGEGSNQKALIYRDSRMVNGKVVNEPQARFEERKSRAEKLYNDRLNDLKNSSFYQNAESDARAKMEETLAKRVGKASYDDNPDASKLTPAAINSTLEGSEKRKATNQRKSTARSW